VILITQQIGVDMISEMITNKI